MIKEIENWLSMSEASRYTPYSAEYLSLLARKKKLTSKKVGNTWYTTKSVLDDYMKKQMILAQVQNGNFQSLQPIENHSGPATASPQPELKETIPDRNSNLDLEQVFERVID